jgi:DNA-binding transcriptional ArsR family regulator
VSTRPDHPSADAVLGALGDPTRRAVLEAVASRGPLTATELAGPAGISRQAVSKHLGVLEQAGLVAATRVGREARYAVVPGSLDPAALWLDRIGSAWDERLARLRRHLADG